MQSSGLRDHSFSYFVLLRRRTLLAYPHANTRRKMKCWSPFLLIKYHPNKSHSNFVIIYGEKQLIGTTFSGKKKREFAILRDNGTFKCTTRNRNTFWTKLFDSDWSATNFTRLRNKWQNECRDCRPFSFLSLQHSEDVVLIMPEGEFDLTVLLPEQLARMLDTNPTRLFTIDSKTWTAEQSNILATRPYILNLYLSKTTERSLCWCASESTMIIWDAFGSP